MRYHQLLLEYDHSKTVKNYEPGIIQHLIKDETTANGSGWFDYVEEYKEGKISAEKCASLFVTFVEKLDTTPNKKYAQWICRMYATGGIARVEDFYRTKEAIEHLHTLKTSGYFQRNREAIPYSDINRYKSLSELEDYLETLDDNATVSNAIADKPTSREYRLLANTDQWQIVVPLTQKAASYFGINTRWCTTSENGGMFESYSKKGPLYIILDKPNNRRWQLHFETMQFMDEKDHAINLRMLPLSLITISPTELLLKFIQDNPRIIPELSEERFNEIPEEKLVKYISSDAGIISSLSPERIAKFTPNLVEQFCLGAQKWYAMNGCPVDADRETKLHYRKNLKALRVEALCIAYETPRNDNKVANLIELKDRSENVTAQFTENGNGWSVYGFENLFAACLYDLKTENNSDIWKFVEYDYKGRDWKILEQITNVWNKTNHRSAILQCGNKKYYFNKHSGRVDSVWNGGGVNEIGPMVLYKRNERPVAPQLYDYNGTHDPAAWDAVFKALGMIDL